MKNGGVALWPAFTGVLASSALVSAEVIYREIFADAYLVKILDSSHWNRGRIL